MPAPMSTSPPVSLPLTRFLRAAATAPVATAVALMLAFTLAACGSLPVRVMPPDDLAGAVPLAVQGRTGFSRHLTFGEFDAEDRSRIFQPGAHAEREGAGIQGDRHELDFFHAFETSRRQLVFVQHGPAGELRVQALSARGKHTEGWELGWGHGNAVSSLRILDSSDVFSGVVLPALPDQPTWHFQFSQASQGGHVSPGRGWAEDGRGRALAVVPLSRLEGIAPDSTTGAEFGYAIQQEGRTLAAVGLFGEARVWLREGLPADDRLLLASLCSAMLLRPAAID